MTDAPLMLSVSGLRGLIGQSLTPPVACRFAAAFGDWLRESLDDPARTPHIVIGRDSRPSGEMIEAAAIAGLLSVGCRITRVGIVSTPGVGIMAEHLNADGGMVLTASHNPIIWNGIKPLVFTHGRIQAPPKDCADRIISRFHNNQYDYVPVSALQPIATRDDAAHIHTQLVLQQVDVQAIRDCRFKVVVDGVHGAAGAETAALFDALNVELVHLYAEPTGQFPHTPEPTKENLIELTGEVLKHKADIGFAQDPDADRLAIVDENGTYIGEEYTLALAAMHILDKRGHEAKGAMLAANLSTSRMMDDVAAKVGAKVIRTPVGEANVASAMKQHNAVVGGEGNGGIILPQVTYIRDSLTGMAVILEMLAHHKKKTLSDCIGRITRYSIVKEKIDVDAELSAKLKPVLSQRYSEQQLDTQDGVRIDWPDCWVHIRPSNTEPIIRLIAEAPTTAAARQLIADVRQTLDDAK